MKKINKNLVYIHTPKDLDLTEEFGALSNKQKDIIKFIISEFNYRTKKNGAARHNRNTMIKFFNVSPNLYKQLIKLLEDKKIIDKTESSSFGKVKRNNGYTLLNTFECNDEESIQHIYQLNNDDCPEFIKKWVHDEFQILNESSYVPTPKETEIVKRVTKNQLLDEISLLKQILDANGISYPSSNYISSDELKTVDVDVESNSYIIDNKNEYIASNAGIKNTYNKKSDTYTINDNGVLTIINEASKLINYLSDASDKRKQFIKNMIAFTKPRTDITINDVYNNNQILKGDKVKIDDKYYFNFTRI